MAGKLAADIAELISQLADKSSEKRRSAARHLGRLRDKSAGDPIYHAFLSEIKDVRTYQTQAAMAEALGLLTYTPAADQLLEIVQGSPDHDLLSRTCATAYCRLTRSSLSDAAPVLRLLSIRRFSVSMGALLALGCDRMIPSDEDIQAVLTYAAAYQYQKGFGDPRYGAAIAAAGWRGPTVEQFLTDCLQSGDSGVVEAAQSSLKRKYVKCR
jgi:HEAT repeat protein